ncbi:hypothetical protein AALP_AAs58461U000100 [Arabis alpina]|uniref:Uncharacterized protein n=1 Tax=Arabis alpina TaxID=50452 RepID=A0A087G1U8_ARAAL|nr:hypothetical protein AALP_AAs58461U000100 [Arabis alpina]
MDEIVATAEIPCEPLMILVVLCILDLSIGSTSCPISRSIMMKLTILAPLVCIMGSKQKKK